MNRSFYFGIFLLSSLILVGVFGPLISSYTYYEIELSAKNLEPGTLYWFGSDDLGRDLFTRCCFGIRISLFVGVAAALIDMCIGVFWGSVAGFCGGHIDNVMMRIADILYSLPSLLIVILLMVVMGPGIASALVAMTIINWITMARVVRGEVMRIKVREFVLAADALGLNSSRILFAHILPNAIGHILVTMTLTVPTALFTEAFLSFMGLGVQAPYASLGSMASDGLPALSYYPWRLFFPAAILCTMMLSFNLISEGIKETFNP